MADEDVPARHERFPALDGLRGLAIAAVVVYHLSDAALPGGYAGVDLFFVLSGFLITRLLVSEWQSTGGVRLRSFWARRAKRLLPGLLLMIAATAIVAMVFRTAVNAYVLRPDGLAAVFYFANWHFLAANQSYFGHIGFPSPLEHTWTLSIEEQFYVLWPLFLLGALAIVRGRVQRLLVPVGVLAAGSLCSMALVYQGGRGIEAAYFGTECRAFELLAGALLALVFSSSVGLGARLRGRPSAPMWCAGFAGLAGVGVFFALAKPTAFTFEGGLGLTALGGVAMIAACLGPSPLSTVFSLAPLRFIGRISYELYLWHWPVIVVTDDELHFEGIGRVAFILAVTLALSLASYYLVDAPVRRARFASAFRRVCVPASVAVTCGLVIAAVPVTAGATSPAQPSDLGHGAAPTRYTSAVFGVHLPAPAGHIDLGFQPSTTHRVRVMFIGDSVMYQLELALGAALSSTGEATTAEYGAILGWSPRAGSDFSRLAHEISVTHPDLVVAEWSQDNTWIGQHGVAAYQRDVLGPLLRMLLARSDGVKGVVFVGQPPQPPLDSWMPKAHATVYDPAGMRAWQSAVVADTSQFGGRVAFVPATQMLEFGGTYSTWLASPSGAIQRVRQIDDFHLCLNGGVRYAAGAAQGIVRLLSIGEPRADWWLGPYATSKRWYELPSFPPGMCPNDAPARLGPAPPTSSTSTTLPSTSTSSPASPASPSSPSRP
jgi:peptidoglycan/LPS O-acetylase OafA/YrhL